MKKVSLPLLAGAMLASGAVAAQYTNTIDNLTTFQSLSAEDSSVTNTVSAAGAIGGFRTITLDSIGNDPGFATTLSVSAATQRLTLSTPEGPTPTFTLLWGGANGTSGLGGVAFGGGETLDLFTSVLSFSLRSADTPSNFTWTFTDTSSQTATYTGILPAHSSTNAPLAFNITLDSFANAGGINWNSVDYVSFSGGGVSGMDISVPAPYRVVASTVPEPGTWTLLATGAAVVSLALRRRQRRG